MYKKILKRLFRFFLFLLLLSNQAFAQNGKSEWEADKNIQLKIGGYIQSDGRFFLKDGDETKPQVNTFLLRRVRPVFEGTVGKYTDFRIMPDFGGGKIELQDAYLDLRFSPQVRIKTGKFKTSFGLERLQSGTNLLFVERAFPTSLGPNRDIGLQVHGDVFSGTFNYALGIFNGVVDGGSADSDSNDEKDYATRIFIHPFKNTDIFPLQNLGLGIAGTMGNQLGTSSASGLSAFKTPGQQTFFGYGKDVFVSGGRNRLSPQAYYYFGSLGILGEYVLATQKVTKGKTSTTLKNSSSQLAVSYFLTGEENSFKGVKPKNDFEPGKKRWGAFEIAARFHTLTIDDKTFPVYADPNTSAKKAAAWGLGLNWFLNRNVKLTADYEQTGFKGGSKTGDRGNEQIIFTRFQVAY